MIQGRTGNPWSRHRRATVSAQSASDAQSDVGLAAHGGPRRAAETEVLSAGSSACAGRCGSCSAGRRRSQLGSAARIRRRRTGSLTILCAAQSSGDDGRIELRQSIPRTSGQHQRRVREIGPLMSHRKCGRAGDASAEAPRQRGGGGAARIRARRRTFPISSTFGSRPPALRRMRSPRTTRRRRPARRRSARRSQVLRSMREVVGLRKQSSRRGNLRHSGWCAHEFQVLCVLTGATSRHMGSDRNFAIPVTLERTACDGPPQRTIRRRSEHRPAVPAIRAAFRGPAANAVASMDQSRQQQRPCLSHVASFLFSATLPALRARLDSRLPAGLDHALHLVGRHRRSGILRNCGARSSAPRRSLSIREREVGHDSVIRPSIDGHRPLPALDQHPDGSFDVFIRKSECASGGKIPSMPRPSGWWHSCSLAAYSPLPRPFAAACWRRLCRRRWRRGLRSRYVTRRVAGAFRD